MNETILHEIVDEFIYNAKLQKILHKAIEDSAFVLSQPSSTSGKFHPEDEICEFGMVRHILKALTFSVEGMRRYKKTGIVDRDIVVASIILHDIPYKMKWKEEEGRYITDRNHALKCAEYFVVEATKIDLEYYLAYPISCAIAYHSGIWQDYDDIFYDIREKDMTYNKIVMEADFYCSRKFVTTDINNVKELLNGSIKG